MADRDFDVLVLGGGSAGTAAARAATLAGARTAMINDGEPGGLCILRGCMPTKAMLASAHALHETRRLGPFGIRLDGAAAADFPAVMDRKDALVARFLRAKLASIERGGYEVIDGRGRFAPGGGVEVNGRVLRARGYVLATGSEPARLPIPGFDCVPVWSSDDVMELRRRPESLLVQGAGPIGLELAQFFARMGTRVLLVNRSPLLSRHDPDSGRELHAALADEENLELAVPGAIEVLTPDGDGLRAQVRHAGDTRTVRADALLVATGRLAALDGLGLEHLGLERHRPALAVDATMATAHPDVWVAGDATHEHQILHRANEEGAVAGHNAAVGRGERSVDDRLLMSVVFTDPPFARVGLSEQDAADAGRDAVVGAARFPETGRAITMETRHGLWKLVVDRESGEILGSTVLGPRADDLVHTVSAMMYYRGRVEDILRMPWYHPTLSEVALDLARSALAPTHGATRRS